MHALCNFHQMMMSKQYTTAPTTKYVTQSLPMQNSLRKQSSSGQSRSRSGLPMSQQTRQSAQHRYASVPLPVPGTGKHSSHSSQRIHGTQLQFKTMAERITNNANPINTRRRTINDLRERIEIVHTSEYQNFLRYLFPAFLKVLRTQRGHSTGMHGNPPVQFIDNDENKFRNTVMEILNRLPNNDALKPYVPHLLDLSMLILETDNEENALISLRIIFDLHKNYRPTLEHKVQPFLDFVRKLYGNLKLTMNSILGRPVRSHSLGPNKQLARSTESFKVLTECPLIVMLLFQLYPR